MQMAQSLPDEGSAAALPLRERLHPPTSADCSLARTVRLHREQAALAYWTNTNATKLAWHEWNLEADGIYVKEELEDDADDDALASNQ